MSDTSKDIEQLKNRLKDLANKSYGQSIYTFSGFLGLSEQDVYHQIEKDLSFAHPALWGGYEGAERVIISFGEEESLGYEAPIPIVCLHITPMAPKFAEKLSHRDFLGALMNLGIERNTLGDILVNEKECYLFCLENISQYIINSLDKVRHNFVKCTIVANIKEVPKEDPRELTVQVASLRADALISKVYNLSRESSLELFRSSRVFINGRLTTDNSKLLKPGDVVNARGFGKFTLSNNSHTTRKGKISQTVLLYR